MTESTKSGSDQPKPEKEALKLERQKCKVLKNALKDEKKAKDLLEVDIKNLLLKNEQL
jgi:hypothetical protein